MIATAEGNVCERSRCATSHGNNLDLLITIPSDHQESDLFAAGPPHRPATRRREAPEIAAICVHHENPPVVTAVSAKRDALTIGGPSGNRAGRFRQQSRRAA